jgi:hypothetical protein
MYMYGIIYLITNLITLDQYIGQTTGSIKNRWYYHCRKDSRCLRLKNSIQSKMQ